MNDRVDDFPAAHSMDTDWFAVDADGNVGLFQSSEDGAVPMAAGTLGGAAEASFDSLLFYAAAAARKIVAGSWDARDARPALDRLEQGSSRILLAIAEAPAHIEVIDPAAYDVLSTTPWIGFSREAVKAPQVRQLAQLDGVIVLATESMLYEAFDEREDLPVYVFGREHGDDPGRYTRISVPAEPLRVETLPTEARDAVGSLRVPVAFTASSELHLGDHLADREAYYWGKDWTLRSFGDEASTAGTANVPPARAIGARHAGRRMRWIVLLVVAVLVAFAALWLR